MTETTSKPEHIDEHGATHRHGCTMPGWISDGRAVAGWHAVRCSECGTTRLVRAGGAR